MNFTGSYAPDWGVSTDSSWGVTDWVLHYDVRQHEAPVLLRSAAPYLAAGIFRWSVVVRFLLANDLPAAAASNVTSSTSDLGVGLETVITLYPNISDTWSGTAVIESYDFTSPLDGPIGGVARLRGTANLTVTVA